MARIGITAIPENGIEISRWTGTELCIVRLYKDANVATDTSDNQCLTADVVDLPMIYQDDIQGKISNHFDDYFELGKQNDIVQKIVDGNSSAATYESFKSLANELDSQYKSIEVVQV
ncbi:MAG: hypothetical protein AB9883_07470 [Acidaminococcaceae bacterium]